MARAVLAGTSSTDNVLMISSVLGTTALRSLQERGSAKDCYVPDRGVLGGTVLYLILTTLQVRVEL